MARFYKIRYGTLYLSQDGTIAGLACRLSVSNVDALVLGYTGQTVQAIDGTPVNLTRSGGKGIQFEISIQSVAKAQFEAQKTLIKNAIANRAPINIIGTGDGGNFDVNALPILPNPFSHERFSGGRVLNVTHRFMTI